jgi:hypothetical protein
LGHLSSEKVQDPDLLYMPLADCHGTWTLNEETDHCRVPPGAAAKNSKQDCRSQPFGARSFKKAVSVQRKKKRP